MGSGVAERTHPFYASCVIESHTDDENHADGAVDEDDKENSFAIAGTFLGGYIAISGTLPLRSGKISNMMLPFGYF